MTNWERRFGPASWRAIEPMAPGACGATFSPKVSYVCGFRFIPARFSDVKAAGIPI